MSNLLQKDKLRPVPKSIALLYSNNPLDTSYYRKKAVSFISALEQSTGTTINSVRLVSTSDKARNVGQI